MEKQKLHYQRPSVIIHEKIVFETGMSGTSKTYSFDDPNGQLSLTLDYGWGNQSITGSKDTTLSSDYNDL